MEDRRSLIKRDTMCGIHGRSTDTSSGRIGTKSATFIIPSGCSKLSPHKRERLHLQTPDHTKLVAPIDDFVRCQFNNWNTSGAQEAIPIFQHRLTQAAQMLGAP